MDFLLSPEGMIYNAPALFVLALLLWKRTYIGGVMAVLAFFRVGWPVLGGPGQPIEFSVHGALVFTVMFAWTREDWIGNGMLFVAGVGMLYVVEASLGSVLPESAGRDVEVGIFVGMVLAIARALVWGTVALVRTVQKPSPTQEIE